MMQKRVGLLTGGCPILVVGLGPPLGRGLPLPPRHRLAPRRRAGLCSDGMTTARTPPVLRCTGLPLVGKGEVDATLP